MTPEERVAAAKEDLRTIREEWFRKGLVAGLTFDEIDGYRRQTRAARERLLAAADAVAHSRRDSA